MSQDTKSPQEPTAPYRALCRIDRDRDTYLAGETIHLPAETAARLLAMNPPAIEAIATQAPFTHTGDESPSDVPAAAPAVARANAKTTIERVRGIEDVAALLALREQEETHEDGARQTVLEAIDARLAALSGGTAGADA